MIIVSGTIIYDESGFEYEVLDFIGSGSFGNVYKIKKKDTKEIFALKTIQTPFADKTILKAFINEGNLALKISHENTIKYYYFHDGIKYPSLPPYIIMEFANEGTLEKILREKKQNNEYVSNDELILYFSQLIDGMEAINHTLVHRDIKPDNILISDGKFKITDFGLAKVVEEKTRTSTFKGIGCIQYLAPEGWKYEKNTIQMDIYSMGFVFYELASLKHPLKVNTNDIQEWHDAHLFQHVKNVEQLNTAISPLLSQSIMGMIEKNTKNRFKSWNEIRSLLKKENLPPTEDTQLVNNLLKKRLEKDSKNKAEQLKAEQKSKEIEKFKKVIRYQFENDIVLPIVKFIDEFNNKYGRDKITYKKSDFGVYLEMPSRDRISCDIKPLLENDFYRSRTIDDYGRRTNVVELKMPKYENRIIMAWGLMKSSDGRGFNLILVEKNEEIYGDWYMLINNSNPLYNKKSRPSPFPFEFSEIEKEIRNIKSVHIYNTKDIGLDIDYIKKFIGEYI